MKTIRSDVGMYVEFEAVLVHSTEGAILIEYEGKKTWIPKSVNIGLDNYHNDNGDIMIDVCIPEKFAIEKEIV